MTADTDAAPDLEGLAIAASDRAICEAMPDGHDADVATALRWAAAEIERLSSALTPGSPAGKFKLRHHPYVHGFESGGIALQMERGETLIARSVVHAENRATLIQMAEFYGYDCSFGATSDETYLSFEASKVRPIRDPSKPNLKLVAS